MTQLNLLPSDPTLFSQLRQQAGVSIDELAPLLGFSSRTLYRWEKGEGAARNAALSLLRAMAGTAGQRSSAEAAFQFIDLFAGIGGLRRAFEPIGGKCVFTCEWDRHSQQTYRANYHCDHEIAGDIRQVAMDSIPRHDVLLAGFPCQPFSIAGVSKKNALNRPHGFRCEAQGTLFFHVASVIEHHRPKAFLLENVKNLLSHDKGNTFDVIHRTLTEELGYQVHSKVIDARSWVPQHRERIFIVGFREPNAFSFDDLRLPVPEAGPRLGSILHPEDGSEPGDGQYTDHRGKVMSRYTLTDHLWGYLQAYSAKHKAKGNGFGFGLVGPDSVSRTLSARYHKDGSEILIRQRRRNPRRLTPRECARLMGFDSPGGSTFTIPVSDTQAYRQFGNAVVVPAVRSVAEHMRPFLTGDHAGKEESRAFGQVALG